MNTDCLRAYLEQGLAPIKSEHLADLQSTGDRENLELSVANQLFEEPLDLLTLHTDKNSKQYLTSRLNAHAPRLSLSKPSSPSPRRSGNTSVVLPRNGSPVLNDREPYVHDCYLIRVLSIHWTSPSPTQFSSEENTWPSRCGRVFSSN